MTFIYMHTVTECPQKAGCSLVVILWPLMASGASFTLTGSWTQQHLTRMAHFHIHVAGLVLHKNGFHIEQCLLFGTTSWQVDYILSCFPLWKKFLIMLYRSCRVELVRCQAAVWCQFLAIFICEVLASIWHFLTHIRQDHFLNTATGNWVSWKAITTDHLKIDHWPGDASWALLSQNFCHQIQWNAWHSST